MDSLKPLICKQATYWENQTIEQEVDNYIETKARVEKTKIQIKITDNKIIYLKQEAILRVEEHHFIHNPEIFSNLEQIKSLFWQGEYNQKQKKEGKWIPYWNKIIKINAGGYYRDGQKQGLWIDLCKNYGSKNKIYETGEYLNDVRIGKWIYLNDRTKINGGLYNDVGKKIGKWIELNDGFYQYAQITHNGEYNSKSIKVGKWDIMYCNDQQRDYKQIGGGLYDQEGRQKKIGKWVELIEGFDNFKQVTLNGQYNMNGMKVDRWAAMYQRHDKTDYQQIGGGLYDKEGDQKKIEQWVELDEGFHFNKQVAYNGNYNINGKKVGKWVTQFCKPDQQLKKQIGGGEYDKEGNQKKIGKWVELYEGFENMKYVTYKGEYNMNGMKIGRWNILFNWLNDKQMNIINMYFYFSGGGVYDQEGNQIKIGQWVELDEGFFWDKQISYSGYYNRNGKKIGIWNTLQDRLGTGVYNSIGGGSYCGQGNQIKQGKWVELDEGFYYNKQVVYQGSYNMNGMKIGKWYNLVCLNETEFVYMDLILVFRGDGIYDNEGNQQKLGEWVELDEGFNIYKQIIYKGEYCVNGKKLGRWEIMYKKNLEGEYKQIGGGSYDQEGEQKKIGQWIELGEGFNIYKEVIEKGEYNQAGKQIGSWAVLELNENKQLKIKNFNN